MTYYEKGRKYIQTHSALVAIVDKNKECEKYTCLYVEIQVFVHVALYIFVPIYVLDRIHKFHFFLNRVFYGSSTVLHLHLMCKFFLPFFGHLSKITGTVFWGN